MIPPSPPAVDPAPIEVSAGPVRAQLADGELRYLTVHDREVVRRIYFAVRTGSWATVPPRFSLQRVTRSADHFRAELSATCSGLDGVDTTWNGTIEGERDGTITFTATATARTDFASNRIGLCVLFGTPDAVGQRFTTDGTPKESVFPTFVSDALVASRFTRLATRIGGTSIALVSTGATVAMEDQRTYGDASFKAYAPLPYAYPTVRAGQTFTQSLTLTFDAAVRTPVPVKTPTVSRGEKLAGRVPAFTNAATTAAAPSFGALNTDPGRTRDASALTWQYRPTTHLTDDDTLWENVAVLSEQAASLRAKAGTASLTVSGVTIDPPASQPRPDPRIAGPLGAAWLAVAVKEAALAGLDRIEFAFGPGYAARSARILSSLSGQELVRTTVAAPGALRPPIDAFATQGAIVLINRTGALQKVAVTGLDGRWSAQRLNAATAAGRTPEAAPLRNPAAIALAPYEVCLLRPMRR